MDKARRKEERPAPLRPSHLVKGKIGVLTFNRRGEPKRGGKKERDDGRPCNWVVKHGK